MMRESTIATLRFGKYPNGGLSLPSIMVRIALQVFLGAVCAAACADQTTLDEFIAEAPPAWERVRGHYNSGKAFDRTSTETLTFTSKKFSRTFLIQEKVSRNEIARIDNHISMQSHIVTKTIDESLGLKATPLDEVEPEVLDVSTVINPQYKGRFSKGPPVRLFNYKYTRHIERDLVGYDHLSIPPLRLDSSSMLDRSIVGLPGFHHVEGIRSYQAKEAEEYVATAGDRLVRVFLEPVSIDSHGDAHEGRDSRIEAEVTLDPANAWLVVEFRSKTVDESGSLERTYERVCKYDSANPSYQPNKVVTTAVHYQAGGIETVVHPQVFTDLRDSPLAARDCYLSAHGLPEPVDERRQHAFSWTTGSLVVVVVVLSILVVRKRYSLETE